MKAQILINNSEIGSTELKVIDESMGAVGGVFVPNKNYLLFKSEIQKFTEEKGNANSENFNFRIFIDNFELNPQGGVCLLDSEEFGELLVDASGISDMELNKFRG